MMPVAFREDEDRKNPAGKAPPGALQDDPPRNTPSAVRSLLRWLDAHAFSDAFAARDPHRIEWWRVAPFALIHLLVLLVLWVGISPIALAVAVGLYVVRMFFVTAFYHRYFSHRSFKTGRLMQFFGAAVCCSAGQRGPLWWSAHHRHHHAHADTPEDIHSPRLQGFWWSHMLWFLSNGCCGTRFRNVRDWMRFPELVFLDRFDWIPFIALGGLLFAAGEALRALAPASGTSGAQLVVWGFIVSTVVLYHGTYTINSLSHRFGRRRYPTADDSRNNFGLALLTLGEGWHNNHHYYSGSTRQGFYWWELDLTFYALKAMSWVGLVRDLREPPESVLREGRAAKAALSGRPR